MRFMFGDIRTRKTIQSFVLMLVLLVSFMAGSAPAAMAQSSDLFGDAGVADAAPAADSFVLRSRLVSVNLGVLLGSDGPRDVSAVGEVSLNLFADARYRGAVTKLTKYDADTYVWSGALKGVTGGYFYLAVSGMAFQGHVASTKGVYEVNSAGNGLYRVTQLDQSKMVDHPEDWNPVINELPGPADLGPNADSAARIDVMVVYTPAARTGAGSTAAMKAAIALAMTETNTSYANAGITPRLRLVHVHEIAYTESGNIGTDVSRLANTSDGYLDSVHSLRNKYGADMVSLIVENGGGYCGIADAIMATAATAFDVVQRSGCMTGYYSFGHEFGHLQGARHDVYVDPSTTPFTYGHGYVYFSGLWRTVMAYNNRCSDFGQNCTRLQYFSNDSKTYGGAAMGDPQSRNYLVLNNTALTVANFRTQVIANNFSSSFNGSSAGWTPVYGTWALASGAYYQTAGAVGYFSTIKHTGTFGDVTYQARMKRSGTGTGYANNIIIRGKPTALDAYKEWKPSYMFEYTNNGNFSVWMVSSTGAVTALKNWTASAAIVKGGWNTLKVVAVGSSLKFYINGSLVWTGSNSTSLTGQVGIGMYRGSGTTGELFQVDSASLSTTPTADFNPNADVLPGVPLVGGDVTQSP